MSAENREKILTQVDAHRDEIISLLTKLVQIPSVTGNEQEIQNYIADFVRELDLEVDVWESDWEELKTHPEYVPVTRGYEGRPNVVAVLKGSGGGQIAPAERPHRHRPERPG